MSRSHTTADSEPADPLRRASSGAASAQKTARSNSLAMVILGALVGLTAPPSGASTQPEPRSPTLATATPAAVQAAPPVTAPAPKTTRQSSGLRVFIDPATGRILSQPTAAQIEALRVLEAQVQAAATAARPRSFSLTNGTVGVFLDGAFLSSSHVHRSADGTLHIACRGEHPTSPPHATHHEHPRSEPGAPTVDIDLENQR